MYKVWVQPPAAAVSSKDFLSVIMDYVHLFNVFFCPLKIAKFQQ